MDLDQLKSNVDWFLSTKLGLHVLTTSAMAAADLDQLESILRREGWPDQPRIFTMIATGCDRDIGLSPDDLASLVDGWLRTHIQLHAATVACAEDYRLLTVDWSAHVPTRRESIRLACLLRCPKFADLDAATYRPPVDPPDPATLFDDPDEGDDDDMDSDDESDGDDAGDLAAPPVGWSCDGGCCRRISADDEEDE